MKPHRFNLLYWPAWLLILGTLAAVGVPYFAESLIRNSFNPAPEFAYYLAELSIIGGLLPFIYQRYFIIHYTKRAWIRRTATVAHWIGLIFLFLFLLLVFTDLPQRFIENGNVINWLSWVVIVISFIHPLLIVSLAAHTAQQSAKFGRWRAVFFVLLPLAGWFYVAPLVIRDLKAASPEQT